ncbi:MAG: hypothetical protein WEC33_09810, partial [Dehalococcoidia bacterium]
MRSSAPAAAQRRFHRYVAVLFATTAPLVAVVEYLRAVDGANAPLARFAGPVILTVWAVAVARSKDPNAIPLVLGAMWYIGSLVVVEALFSADVTSFDYTTTFGLMMLFGVLAGTLSRGSRLVWAGGLAISIATWVVTVGTLRGETVDEIAGAARVMRAKALRVEAPAGASDTCGTGGDASGP